MPRDRPQGAPWRARDFTGPGLSVPPVFSIRVPGAGFACLLWTSPCAPESTRTRTAMVPGSGTRGRRSPIEESRVAAFGSAISVPGRRRRRHAGAAPLGLAGGPAGSHRLDAGRRLSLDSCARRSPGGRLSAGASCRGRVGRASSAPRCRRLCGVRWAGRPRAVSSPRPAPARDPVPTGAGGEAQA